MEELFDVNQFNIIEDEENYYFFRALNMADNEDLEKGIIVDEKGNIQRIRTDRERQEENSKEEETKYKKNDPISLEQVYDHIKMHYRKDTNCISLSSNANVSVSYGRGFYKDNYVMVKVPKKELGERVINAGQYMLQEIEKKMNAYVSSIEGDSKLLETLKEIDGSQSVEEIKKAIQTRYTSKEELAEDKAKPRKGISYRAPTARISSYQALSEEQSLEKNKIIAKLTLLERVGGMKPVIPPTTNNNLFVRTIGNAFSSLELIHYGEIEKEEMQQVQKEVVDIFALLQQVEGKDEIVRDLKREVIRFVNDGKSLVIPEDNNLLKDYAVKENIGLEEMYQLTGGKVEYGKAKTIVKDMFYLAKSQSKARELVKLLGQIVGENPKYKEIMDYISENGYAVVPDIITRRNNRGVKLSESVSLALEGQAIKLKDEIKKLTEEEQLAIMESGGLSNVKDILNRII